MRIRKTFRKRIWKKRVTNGGILPFLKFIYFMNFSPSCIFKKVHVPCKLHSFENVRAHGGVFSGDSFEL